jgi:hypothetical protein
MCVYVHIDTLGVSEGAPHAYTPNLRVLNGQVSHRCAYKVSFVTHLCLLKSS